MKVLIIAFGNPDNVFCLSKAVANKVDLTLLYVLSGNTVRQGILDLDLASLNSGLIKENGIINNVIDPELSDYIGKSYRLWLLKTKSRKMIFKKYGFSNLKICYDAVRELRKEKFDIIHYNGISGFMLYFVFFLRRIPKLWTLHDMKAHSGEENLSGNLLIRYLTKKNFHFIQHYQFLKQEFIKNYNVKASKVHQVYSGPFDILKMYKSKSINIEGKFILFSGRISKYKGVEVLIEAFSRISQKYPDIYLVVAGKANYDFNYDKYSHIKNIKVLNRYVENAELAYLFENCLLVCTPYIDATHSAVIMTSYAFNKSVLSSNLEGLNEVVINNRTGILFESENHSELTQVLDNVLNDLRVLKKYEYEINRVTAAGHLSWDEVSANMQNIYSKVLMESA